MDGQRIFPYLLILIAGLLWGATFSLTLIATADGAHPLALVSWQILLTAVIFAGVCLVSKVPLFNLRHFRHYLFIAVIGVTAPILFYYSAAPHLSAGILSITVSTVPMFTYVLMLILRYESIILKRMLGIVLGIIAVVLLVVPDQGLSSDDASWWILLVVLCSWFYAMENVYISKGMGPEVDIREILFGSNMLAVTFQFPVAIYLGVAEPVTWLFTDAGLAIVGITVASAFAYAMFFYTIRHSGPVFASQCAYIVTIAGVVWGIIIFSEQHTVWVWASVVVMMMGLVLVTPDKDTGTDESAEPVTESGNA